MNAVPHTREGITAKYHGESGYSAYHRTKEHIADIKNDDGRNAFAKHLQIHHPEHTGEPSSFTLKAERTFRKCLERQVSEGIEIANSDAEILLNSKSEFHQPAVTRIVTTREPRSCGKGS